jgi:hypothetical protein
LNISHFAIATSSIMAKFLTGINILIVTFCIYDFSLFNDTFFKIEALLSLHALIQLGIVFLYDLFYFITTGIKTIIERTSMRNQS